MPCPTSASFLYAHAQSMCLGRVARGVRSAPKVPQVGMRRGKAHLYPDSMATLTASLTCPGSLFHVLRAKSGGDSSMWGTGEKVARRARDGP